MKKIIIIIVILGGISFSDLFAQTIPSTEFIQNQWRYKEISDGNVQEDVEKNFSFQFKEDGNGHLMVTLTFTTEGEAPIVFLGGVGFTYSIADDSDDPSRVVVEVDYGQFSFEFLREDSRRIIHDYDENEKTDLINELSNKTLSYYLQRSGQYLVVEGFEQNEQSQFTYFTSNRTYRN